MANIITAAFAFKEGFSTSMQLNEKAGNSTTEMYLKNLFVALTSAKRNNPDDTVCLCVNLELPKIWESRFEKEGIKIRKIGFSEYIMPKDFIWALAFYKLCVLNTLVKEGMYERYLIIDADTYTTLNYKDLWLEADKGVLLYPLGHSFSHPDRDEIRTNFRTLYPEESEKLPIVHYGGEFICGNIVDLKIFMDKCNDVFVKIVENDYSVEKRIGDEDIWSMAAALLSGTINIICASPYLFRFWTEDFYLVSTVTVSNPVSIWHLPSEKRTGLIRLYNHYAKEHEFPNMSKAMKMLGIITPKRPVNLITVSNKVDGKLKKWKIKK